MPLAARPKTRRCEKCFARLCADESALTHEFNGRCRANAPPPVKNVHRTKKPKRTSDSWYQLDFD